MQDIAQACGLSRQAIYLHFGSRVGLMVATVQYVDEAARLTERTQYIRDEEDVFAALDMFVDFWAEYVPTIYGLAKQLLLLRESGAAAAAAWRDRNKALRDGVCRHFIERLEQDRRLAPEWPTDVAIDALWMFISIQTWENLVVERGWPHGQYAAQLKQMIKRTLTTAS